MEVNICIVERGSLLSLRVHRFSVSSWRVHDCCAVVQCSLDDEACEDLEATGGQFDAGNDPCGAGVH